MNKPVTSIFFFSFSIGHEGLKVYKLLELCIVEQQIHQRRRPEKVEKYAYGGNLLIQG